MARAPAARSDVESWLCTCVERPSSYSCSQTSDNQPGRPSSHTSTCIPGLAPVRLTWARGDVAGYWLQLTAGVGLVKHTQTQGAALVCGNPVMDFSQVGLTDGNSNSVHRTETNPSWLRQVYTARAHAHARVHAHAHVWVSKERDT